MSIFISHSHSDARLASCFEDYLEAITSKRIKIHRSSKSGDIEYGDSWIDWINTRVATAKITFVLLTPSSFTSKWVLWEAGAVSGVKRAQLEGKEHKKRVIPILFLIPSSENLGPFQSQHNANGLDVEQIFELGKSILNDLQVDNSIPQDLVYDSLTKLSDISKDFVKKAENVLHDLQIFKRDELVQEWISRLDRELAKNNAQYVTSASRWINVAFLGAGKASDMSSPIDFRIHIRLASGFRMLKDWENAKIQLELARLLSPRDMMVIRELGRCALELRHENEALKYLNEMKDLDHDIYDGDPEAFNLHIRILITKNDWPKAFELLKNVNSQLSGDTYIANMLAIAVMKVEGIESARKYFQRLRLLEEKQSGSSIWSIGNQINAALGLGEIDSAKILLEQLKKKPDASPNRESITRYFDEIIESQPKLDFKWKEYWP